MRFTESPKADQSVSPDSGREAIGRPAPIGTETGRTNRSRQNVYGIERKTAAGKTSRLKQNNKIPGRSQGNEDMNTRDDNQELYEIHYVLQEGTEDKIYYIVARSLINAIDRFYKLQPTNKIRLIRLLAERDIGRFSMRTNLTVCTE